MSISQAEIIAQKTATKLANKKLKVALIISSVYVLLYNYQTNPASTVVYIHFCLEFGILCGSCANG